MGVPVTIDSDDIEKLIFATGALRDVEHALDQSKGDQLVRNGQLGLTEARSRIERAWRGALRTAVKPLPEITDIDLAALREFVPSWADSKIGYPVDVRTARYGDAQRLMAKGLVELGASRLSVIWSAGASITHKDDPFQQRVRFTQRAADAMTRAGIETVLR